MKRLILILMMLLISANVFGYGIVANTSTRDTLNIPFAPLDSMGSPVNIVSGDSIYIMVYYPGGALAFRDSMAWNDASILRAGFEDFSGCSTYTYMERVSVLDGTGTGVDGVYSYVLIVDDNTSASLLTYYRGNFQVVNSTLESSLDSTGLAAVNSSKALDSLADILDSLESHDGWIAHQSTSDSLYDSLLIILDSLEALEAWVAHQTTVDSIYDSLTNLATVDEVAQTTLGYTDTAWAADSPGDRIKDLTTNLATVDGNVDDIETILGGTLDVNVSQISGDGTAADNFETMLDGTGGQQLSLGRLAISGDNSTNGSFQVVNTSGDAVQFTSSGGDGHGLELDGNGSGNGLDAYGASGIQAFGSVYGLYATGTQIGIGAYGTNAAGIDVEGTTYGIDLNGDGFLANITGNLSGSVGSVTGAVGSVTGAVGSVTGNVGGNVTGSVGSISGITFPTNFSDLSITVSTGLVDINDKTGFSLSAAQWEEVWRNIDTTNIDSSDIGAWLTNNLAGAGSIDYEKVWYDIDTTNIDTSDIGAWLIAQIDSLVGVNIYDSLATTDEMATEVWRNRDTTDIDSSDIGVWLVNNLSGGASIDYEQVWYNIDTANIDTSAIGVWLSNNMSIDYEQIWYNIDTTNIDTSNLGAWIIAQMDSIVAVVIFDSTSSLDDITEGVWQNIDTSNVDSSDIGAWLVNNLSGTSGLTAEEIMDSLFARLPSDTTTGTYLAELYRAARRSYDSILIALDSLENQDDWVGDMRYTNSDSTLSIKRLVISGANSTNYSLYIKNTNGPGALIDADGDNFTGLSIAGGSTGSTTGLALFGTSYGMNANGATSSIYLLGAGNIDGDLSGTVDSVLKTDDSVIIDVSSQNMAFADSIANRVLEDSSSYQGAAASLSYAGIDSTAAANPTHFYGPSASGSGSDTVKIFAVDTSGTDTAIASVKLSFKDLTGSDWSAPQYTGTGGHIYLTATAGDTIVLRGQKTGYIWSIYDTVFVTGAMTDTLNGYNVPLSLSGGTDVCVVYAIVTDISGDPVKGAVMTMSLVEENVIDSCNPGVPAIHTKTAISDSTGLLEMSVIKSKCLTGDGFYSVTIYKRRNSPAIYNDVIEVPDESSYNILDNR